MFQMQSHHDGVWTPMEDGAGKSVWRPRASAMDAARKCLTWTGLVGIPAMRVVDLADGAIVWADTAQYPESGPPVVPAWDAGLRESVRRELRESHGGVADDPDESPDGRMAEATLFDLLDVDGGTA